MSDYPKELLKVAQKVVWFKSPEETLKNPRHFLCYLMQYGLVEDIIVAQKYFSKKDFKQAFNTSYPNIMDKRSLAYWKFILIN